MQLHFHIEQIALCPQDPARAIALLSDMGLSEWARDHVVARGSVYDQPFPCENEADLAFNYQATRGLPAKGWSEESAADIDARILGELPKPLELEVLHYTSGDNWMNYNPNSVSHLGMHCSAAELEEWRAFFAARGIGVAQEVRTQSHTNPAIAGKRSYTYAIFDTREILGVDVKLIVRHITEEQQ